MERFCPVCNEKIKGRIDKIFCSDTCRSSHNYEKRQQNETFYLEVNRQIHKNRKILKAYNKLGYTTVRQEDLHKEGCDPNYFTHYWKNAEGKVYLFVFDFGFLALAKNGKSKYLIVNWQEYMRKDQ